MPLSHLTLDVADRIATITVNRPDKLNALNDATIAELGEAIDQVKTTTADTGKRVDELSTNINARLVQVSDLLDKSNAIAGKIEKGQGTMGLLMNDPRLYESLVDTGKTLSLTVTDLRRLVAQWEQEGFTLKLK